MYDNFTAIQHWLNRCCFGVHKEMAYLGYSAYHEDDYSSHSGFGLALNDYAVMMYNIQTFIRLGQLPVDSPYLVASDSAAFMLQEHAYFYLDIPNFAKASKNESAIALIRLMTNDSHIDIKCQVTSQNIKVVDIKNMTGSNTIIWTNKKSPYDMDGSNLGSKISSSLPAYKEVIDPAEFKLTQSADPIGNGLIINKWIAATISPNIIEKYQIIIQYNNREEVPLIITKKGKL